MVLMEVVSMDFVDVRPAEIQAADSPKKKLNSYKNTQKSMNPSGEILIVFAHLGAGNGLLSYSVFRVMKSNLERQFPENLS